MNKTRVIVVMVILISFSCNPQIKNSQPPASQAADAQGGRHLYMDVHNLEPGKVKYADVAGAHQKDLATQDSFKANFMKFWVDEAAGKVYCLVEAFDSASVYMTHKLAHGLLPDRVQQVTDGPEAKNRLNGPLFLDVHRLGSVTAQAVRQAHDKDLAVQDKFGANFVNYWVDDKRGIVMCLVEAPDSATLSRAHKEAHGLIPDEVHKVREGN